MPLSDLYDPTRGYLVNDKCVVEAEVAVRKILDYWSYDSKKETGYVGLKNQGATCYMNSLLQTLYHIPYFRKVRCASCFPMSPLMLSRFYIDGTTFPVC
jgi:ubiquitin carboxyl-terminal hydrolase 7